MRDGSLVGDREVPDPSSMHCGFSGCHSAAIGSAITKREPPQGLREKGGSLLIGLDRVGGHFARANQLTRILTSAGLSTR